MPEYVPRHKWRDTDDEIVIIHPSSSVGELEIFEPNTGICLPGVLGNVGGRSEALREQHSLDTPAKDSWSLALGAGTPVVWLMTMAGAHFNAPLEGSARNCVACSCHRPVDIIIVLGPMPVVDDATSILVWTGPLVYRWSMGRGH